MNQQPFEVDNISHISNENDIMSIDDNDLNFTLNPDLNIPDMRDNNFIRNYLVSRNVFPSDPLTPIDYYRYGYLLSMEINDSSVHSANSFSSLFSQLPTGEDSSITSNNTTGENLSDMSPIPGGKKKKGKKSRKIKKNKKGTRKRKMKK
tara:strand:- start:488 stop:934 length:447 start_codon:yes stop_codon:yes gene_type:complete